MACVNLRHFFFPLAPHTDEGDRQDIPDFHTSLTSSRLSTTIFTPPPKAAFSLFFIWAQRKEPSLEKLKRAGVVNLGAI